MYYRAKMMFVQIIQAFVVFILIYVSDILACKHFIRQPQLAFKPEKIPLCILSPWLVFLNLVWMLLSLYFRLYSLHGSSSARLCYTSWPRCQRDSAVHFRRKLQHVWHVLVQANQGPAACPVAKAGAVADPVFHKGYMNTRFNIIRSKTRTFSSIINISHWDEAVYYCGVEVSLIWVWKWSIFGIRCIIFNSTGEFLFMSWIHQSKSNTLHFVRSLRCACKMILSHKMNIYRTVLFPFQL